MAMTVRIMQWLLVWMILVISLLGAGTTAERLAMPCGFSEGECLFAPERISGTGPLLWSVALIGLMHLLLVPGWLLGTMIGTRGGARLGLSCPFTMALWIPALGFIILSGAAPTRWVVLFTVLAIETVLLLLLAVRKNRARSLIPGQAEVLALAAGLVILVLFGYSKLVTENFTGDGVEAYSFGASLSGRMIPSWDLENGAWGFYPSFMSFAYPLQLSSSFLGGSEAASRLPVFIFASGLAGFLVGARREWFGRISLALALVLLVITSGWNYTYDPYFADLAEPTNTDLFFAVCLLGAIWGWRQERLGVFAVSGTIAGLALPAGLPFLLLMLVLAAFLGAGSRGWAWKAILVLCVFVGARVLLSGAINPEGATKFSFSVFLTHHTQTFLDQFSVRQMLTQLWALLVQSGGMPIVFGLSLFRESSPRSKRTVLLIALLVYALSVVLTPQRHPHYVTPVAAMLLLFVPQRISRVQLLWPLLLVLMILGVRPSSGYEPDQRTREFGSATYMVFHDERTAVDNADLLYGQLTIPPWRDESNWGPGKHAWVLYSSMSTLRPRSAPDGIHLLFSEYRDPWEEFSLVADNGTSFLYERPVGWLKAQGENGGCTTCWGWLLKVPNMLWDPLSRWKR